MRKIVYLIGMAALMLGLVTKPAAAADLRVGAPVQRVGPAMRTMHLPDLVIRSAYFTPLGNCRPGGPAMYATVKVQNIGNATSPAKSGVGVVQTRDTGGKDWGNGTGLPALAPGQSTTVHYPIYYLQGDPTYMLGNHNFKVTVNAGRWITESNYANNGYKLVKVTLEPGFCGQGPDITTHTAAHIGRVIASWGNTGVTVGRKDAKRVQNGRCVFDFIYQMSNDGDLDTSPLFLNRLTNEKYQAVAVNSGLHLKVGQTKTLDTEVALTPGKHVLTMSLDASNAVHEANENNNQYHVIVNVDNSCRSPGRTLRPMKPKMMLRQPLGSSANIR